METNIDKQLNIEKEIDLIDLGKKLWSKRKFILKVSLMGLVIGVVVAFSIPKEYRTTVILAPESNSSTSSGSVGALAAMAGFNLGGSHDAGQISPELYPNILESTPFIIGLFNIRINDSQTNIDTTLYYYMRDEQKNVWWSNIFKVIGLFSKQGKTESPKESSGISPITLSQEQTNILDNIKARIEISVDKKNGMITLVSTMQNPDVSALIADTLTSYLQSYIINYRTQKARQDLSFTEKLYIEAKKDYLDSQQKYARYLDENQNVILASYRVNQERLQNEVGLTYSVYNQMAQQLQLAKVKVQDTTPVYTVIQPAVVPLIPEKPKKKLVIAGFVFLSIIVGCGLVIGKSYFGN